MVNLGGIVEVTGHSKTTMSRVFSGNSSFTARESTRHRATRMVGELNYALCSSRPGIPQMMAVLENFGATRRSQDTYFTDVRDALRECAVKSMMSLSFFSDAGSLVEADDGFVGFVSLRFAPIASEDLGRLHEALAHGALIDTDPAPTLFHLARPDPQQTVIKAIYAPCEQGREHIAFIGGDGYMMGSYTFTRDPCTFAFDKRAYLLGMSTDGCVYASGPFTVDNGCNQTEALLDTHVEAMSDAILVTADPLAIDVIQALVARGMKISKGVTVLSIDNLGVCQYMAPALSSYVTERSELAKTALMLLSDAIVGRFRHRHHMLFSTCLVPQQGFIPIEDMPRN